jgi:energy-coupling factor transporter ATP-binding protein EcfA2
MGIKIKGLKIRNFRCIGELDLDFTDPDGAPLDLVVLAGPNGCGKTSVLEAILIILEEEGLMAFQGPDPHRDIRVGREKYWLKATFDINGMKFDKERYQRRMGGMGGAIAGASVYDQLKESLKNAPIGYFSSRRRQKLSGALAITIGNNGENEPDPPEENRLRVFKQRCIDTWTGALYENQKLDPELDPDVMSLFKPLNEVWNVFYPGNKSRFVVGPVGRREGFDLLLLDGNRTKIPVDQLSSGEIEVLTMAGWFTMHDLRGGIVLIDEPELHMHVQWHRAIMRALRVLLPETQIIVATHSWDILKSVMSYERFTLLREGDPRIAVDSKAVIR